MDVFTCNPSLILLGIHAALLDYVEADINDVAVGHREVGASCKRRTSEEVEDKCVKTIGGMPLGHHVLKVCFTILCRSLSVVVDKPHKHVNKNNVWFAKGAAVGRRRLPAMTELQEKHWQGRCSW